MGKGKGDVSTRNKRNAPAAPDILCDNCDGIAARLFLCGRPEDRRFLCNDCGDDTRAIVCAGKRRNDAVRLGALTDATRAIRKQNVRRGLLSRQKYAALERWQPDGW